MSISARRVSVRWMASKRERSPKMQSRSDELKANMRSHSYWKILAVSVGASLVFSFSIALAVLPFSGVVLRVALTALAAGFVLSPLAFWCLKDTDLWRTVPMTLVVIAPTPFGLLFLNATFDFPETIAELIVSAFVMVAIALLVVAWWHRSMTRGDAADQRERMQQDGEA